MNDTDSLGITEDQIFAHIGRLTMENQLLRQRLAILQQQLAQLQQAQPNGQEPEPEPVEAK